MLKTVRFYIALVVIIATLVVGHFVAKWHKVTLVQSEDPEGNTLVVARCGGTSLWAVLLTDANLFWDARGEYVDVESLGERLIVKRVQMPDKPAILVVSSDFVPKLFEVSPAARSLDELVEVLRKKPDRQRAFQDLIRSGAVRLSLVEGEPPENVGVGKEVTDIEISARLAESRRGTQVEPVGEHLDRSGTQTIVYVRMVPPGERQRNSAVRGKRTTPPERSARTRMSGNSTEKKGVK